MLHHQIFRRPDPGQAMVLAAFSYRYDAHLVPDLLENIRSGIHGFVAWDDRAADVALSNEPHRRQELLAAARALGADWILCPDPDERFEQGIADWLPPLVRPEIKALWAFQLCEMYGPAHFRCDGSWGAKTVMRLFPLRAAEGPAAAVLHGPWVAASESFPLRDARLNLYHLRMASPRRRQLRRDLYAAADPERRFQDMGYDYLTDDRGMELAPVSADRAFHPPFVEDHGLWAPDPGDLGPIRPDPYEALFLRAARTARRRGHLSAHHVFLDLLAGSPEDDDLRLLAASQALAGAAFDTAAGLAAQALALRPHDLYPRLIRAEALVAQGSHLAAQPDLEALARRVPDSPVITALRDEARRPTTDFTDPQAAWRDLAPADATLHEGPRVPRCDLATVVIGFRSQPGLLDAVRSLLAQDTRTEIVVVNTGGGTVLRDLQPVAEEIRIITCETPLFVGAARNIGVAASRAAWVAFLAGDCRARPGWVAGRLDLHRAQALSVSTAVLPDGDSVLARVANDLTYASRNPDTPARLVQHYGQSFARWHLRRCGLFPPGLRIGEDTALNETASRFARPVWAPQVQTVHRDPDRLFDLVSDARARGQRRAAHGRLRDCAGTDRAGDAVSALLHHRLAAARQRAEGDPHLSRAEQRALAATAWLVAQADVAGVQEGMARIASAHRLVEQARSAIDPTAALAAAQSAWELDPQDPEKARLLAELRQQAGDLEGAEEACRAALALRPTDHQAAQRLTDLIAAQQGPLLAWQTAERLALAAPTSARLWDVAAERAVQAGRAEWAVALAQRALACGPDSAARHARLAHLHGRAGNPVAQAFRGMTAQRLRRFLDGR